MHQGCLNLGMRVTALLVTVGDTAEERMSNACRTCFDMHGCIPRASDSRTTELFLVSLGTFDLLQACRETSRISTVAPSSSLLCRCASDRW